MPAFSPPRSAAVASSISALRATPATFAPSPRNAAEATRPRPLLAPTTRTRLLSSPRFIAAAPCSSSRASRSDRRPADARHVGIARRHRQPEEVHMNATLEPPARELGHPVAQCGAGSFDQSDQVEIGDPAAVRLHTETLRRRRYHERYRSARKPPVGRV